MKTFDYETAWKELARPAFDALPEPVRALYARTCEESRPFHQDRALNVIWPATVLRAAFDATPAPELAAAARAAYFCGHWKPDREPFLGANTGATWKFSDYADQSLRARFNVSNDDRIGTAKVVRILEGYVRVCFSTPDLWTWKEIGPATKETLALAVTVPGIRFKGSRADYEKDAERGMSACAALVAASPDPWLHTERFMVDECSAKYCSRAAAKDSEECAEHQIWTGRGRDV